MAAAHEFSELLQMLENSLDDKSRLRFLKAWCVLCFLLCFFSFCSSAARREDLMLA